MAAGAAPGLAILVCFKVFLSTPSEFQGAVTATRLFDFEHYREVLRLMAHYGVLFGGDTGVSPAWLLIPCVILAGGRVRSDARNGVAAMAMLIAMMCVGYSVVYQITPHPLEWHVWTSLDRLLIQLWPATLFVLFASIQPAPAPDAGRKNMGWAVAVVPVLVASVAFLLVFRSLPANGSATAPPAVASSAGHFFRVAGVSGLHSGWAQVNPSATDFQAAWVALELQSNGTRSESITTSSVLAKSGVIPILERGEVGIAMVNPGGTTATVRGSCGAQTLSPFTIPPSGKIAALVGGVPFALKGCSTLRFDSSVDLGTAAFLTSNASGAKMLSEIPIAQPGNTDERPIHIPYVVKTAGVAPLLVLTNPQNRAVTGRFRSMDSNGRVLEEREYRIPPDSDARYAMAAAAAGRIEVVPDNGSTTPGAFGVVRGTVVVRGLPVGSAFRVFVEKDAETLIDSVLALVNPGDQPATVRVEIGAAGESRSIFVPARGQIVEVAVRTPFKGLARLTSDQPIVATIVRTRGLDGQSIVLSAVPAVSEQPPVRADTRIFPHFALGGGYRSEFVLGSPARLELH